MINMEGLARKMQKDLKLNDDLLRELIKNAALNYVHDEQSLNSVKSANTDAQIDQLNDMLTNFDDKTDENDEVMYTDGDQSKISGLYEQQKLQALWSSGRNWNPLNPIFSEFALACMHARYDVLKAKIDECKKDKDQLCKLLEKRESKMRFNSVLNLVCGARLFYTKNAKSKSEKKKMTNNYRNCLKLLIDSGANLNAKDFAGYTPLMHCFTCYGNDLTKQLAEQLLLAGAKINEQNRIGATVLYEPTISGNYDVCKWLIEHEADPSIPEYTSGATPFSLSRGYIQISGMYSDYLTKKKAAQQSICARCGVESTKRCSQCLNVFYCSRECQQTDWPTHRESCKKQDKTTATAASTKNDDKKSRAEIVRLKPDQYKANNLFGAVYNMMSGNVYKYGNDETDDTTGSSNKFSLKVQIPLDNSRSGLMCYNRKRDVHFMYQPSYDSYDRIVDRVKKDGIMSCKGFFAAWFDNKQLLIDVTNLIPPESW